MVYIHSATAEIRRGKKENRRRQKKPQGKNIMSASATQCGHNQRLNWDEMTDKDAKYEDAKDVGRLCPSEPTEGLKLAIIQDNLR